MSKPIRPNRDHKHVLIIGATRGIGRAVARAFADSGYVVSIIGRRAAAAEDSGDKRMRHWTVDLTERRRRARVFDRIRREHGRLTHLVFMQRYRGDLDTWAGEIEASLTVSKEIVESLMHDFDGAAENSIVMMSSIASRLIAEEQPPGYHVAKAGLVQLARYYAVALGSKGIRVNCVSPGIVLKDESRGFYLRNKKLVNLYRKIIPLGRMSTAEEIAQIVIFLCSPMASAVTGQNIVADGGLSLQWQESLVRRTAFKNLPITRKPRGK